MFNPFKNKKKTNTNKDEELLIKTACILVHAAKMDENYTEKEKLIIKNALKNLGMKDEVINDSLAKAELIEKNSSQLLDFTKVIKNTETSFKVSLIEALWTIIYSDQNLDMYESNLMRRLSGLLYLDKKIVGDIKEKVKIELNK